MSRRMVLVHRCYASIHDLPLIVDPNYYVWSCQILVRGIFFGLADFTEKVVLFNLTQDVVWINGITKCLLWHIASV